MSAAVAPERPVEAWTPPLDAEGLRAVLALVKEWKPLDVEEIFDDLDAAIGNQTPPATTTAALVERLRSHLKQLSDIAVADKRYPPTADMVQLVARGLALRGEHTPAAHQQAVGLAFVTSGLVEELIEARYIREGA